MTIASKRPKFGRLAKSIPGAFGKGLCSMQREASHQNEDLKNSILPSLCAWRYHHYDAPSGLPRMSFEATPFAGRMASEFPTSSRKAGRDEFRTDLWEVCYTQEEIAEAVGLTDGEIGKTLKSLQTAELPKGEILVASHADLDPIHKNTGRTKSRPPQGTAKMQHLMVDGEKDLISNGTLGG